MTGYSWHKAYWKKMIGAMLILSGSFLIMEHLLNFGGFDFEVLGHEYTGIALIAIGFLLNMKWDQFPAFIKALKDRDLKKIFDEGER